MALLDVILLTLLSMAALGEGAPQNDVLRAKSRPFGSGPGPQFQLQPQQRTQQLQEVRPEIRPSLAREFYQSDVSPAPVAPQAVSHHAVASPVKHARPTVPSAPSIQAKDVKPVNQAAFIRTESQQQLGNNQQAALRSQTAEEAEFQKQAESAHYAFSTFVDDGIMGHAHARTEKRDGLAVEGMYSYSDGFFRRTVHYVADQNGYRVVNEINEPIGDGPIIDPKGEARVRSSVGSEYTITLNDYNPITLAGNKKPSSLRQ